MCDQILRVLPPLGMKRWCRKSVMSFLASDRMRTPARLREMASSAAGQKILKETQTPETPDQDEKTLRLSKLSLTAQRMLHSNNQVEVTTRKTLPNDYQVKVSDADRKCDNNENSGVITDEVNTPFSYQELKKRLQSISTDALDVLPPQGNQEMYKPPDIVFESSDEQGPDTSVESIFLSKDLRVINTIKPSPLLGTEDPSIPPSTASCVGCGANLQCQHNTFPGFLPSEHFKLLTENELKVSLCQRCHYIRQGGAFKEVTVKPEEFADMISKIRPTMSVVVMMVDVIDIQGSIVPDLTKYIGTKHPLVIVGNKADLLPPDNPDYLKRVKQELEKACMEAGLCNIRKVLLISAKTGFGIEKLISGLFSMYRLKSDVYIVGTANAGKSSLFNTLLASDYCKNTARDLIQRATISMWPGTTLNMLKFPIMRPSDRTLALRNIRMRSEQQAEQIEEEIRKTNKYHPDRAPTWTLKEDVRQTDVRMPDQVVADDAGTPWGQKVYGYEAGGDGQLDFFLPEPTPFEPKPFEKSHWAHDTPGIINPDQILNWLTPEEVPFVTPATILVPRVLFLKPGDSLFVSGLSRIDYLQGTDVIILISYTGPDIPLRLMATTEADDFYQKFVGTKTLGIPIGDEDRLKKLPPLVGEEFTVKGAGVNTAGADIQLSSLGWVSFALRKDPEITIRAYTPGKKGLRLREPALIPYFQAFRGPRKSKTQFFHTVPAGSVMANKFVKVTDE